MITAASTAHGSAQRHVQESEQGEPACQCGEDETIGLAPADNLHMAFEDPDLVAQHQQLGLISGAVADGCKGEVCTSAMASRPVHLHRGLPHLGDAEAD